MALEINILPIGVHSDSYRSKQPDKVEDTLKLIKIYKGSYEFEYGSDIIDSDNHVSWNRNDDTDFSFNEEFGLSMSAVSEKPLEIKSHNEVNEFKTQEAISNYVVTDLVHDSDTDRDDTVVESDNLLTILKNSVANSKGIEEALKSIANIENINKDFQATQLKLNGQILNELNVLTTTLADTLPVLTASLSVLPKIAKTFEKSVQIQIESEKSTDFHGRIQNNLLDLQSSSINTQTFHIASQATATEAQTVATQEQTVAIEGQKAELAKTATATESMLIKADTRNSHLEKQGDLANYELTEPITDSQGNNTTPVKARADHHAEKAEETKNMNNLEITDDDFNIFDLFDDINPFEEIAKLVTNKEEEE